MAAGVGDGPGVAAAVATGYAPARFVEDGRPCYYLIETKGRDNLLEP